MLQECRHTQGLDRHVPVILRDDQLYNADLDRFFLNLPLDGVRSRHSLRAYGYDVVVWVRFLEEARRKSIWAADRRDVTAYHRARRREDAPMRISAGSWNRAVAALEKLYRWALTEGIVKAIPFNHRDVWRPGHGGRRARVAARNDAYERAPKRSDIRFVSLEDYRKFRDVGLRGLLADGGERVGARDRNGPRNVLFAELLVSTGLRLEEASLLLAAELKSLIAPQSVTRQVWFSMPAALTKGDRGRSILLPRTLLSQIKTYLQIERSSAVAKFKARSGWRAIKAPILIEELLPGDQRVQLIEGSTISLDALTPEERGRLIVCKDGKPLEPATLWLTEIGQPVRPNSWEVVFARASTRCAKAGLPLRVHPHQLRHTFAVHMLAMLVQRRLRAKSNGTGHGEAESYARILGDPLQQVQRLLGHASLATTYIYLDHIATQSDTVDAAVESLLANLPTEARS